jgi:Zn finger protein HypA/HybF involved in hydrogenase expression
MSDCRHSRLLLLPPSQIRFQCRRCHLTISGEELDGGHCPECYESTGVRQYDFIPVSDEDDSVVRYRCEDCGVVITAE